MARIRTIKPEFPQSESMGRVSRDARLLFVELWTICDDHGKARGNSRMLASLLFPYDDDAATLIDGWLDELEREACIVRYQGEGQSYIKVENWSSHQRVDKPSESKFPDPPDDPRTFAKPRENSLRTKEGTKEGTKDQGREGADARPPRAEPDLDPPASLDRICLEALNRWNATAAETGLPQAQRLTDQRRKAMRARLEECGGLDGWDTAMGKIRESRFLCGQNDKGWSADLDFVLQAKSFTKLMEGAYDNRAGEGRQSGTASAVAGILGAAN
jgi:hypothetical protein